MAGFEWCKVWKETSYGTFANPGSPVKNTDYVYAQLVKSNSQTVRVKPKFYNVRSSDSWNRTFSTGSGMAEVTGSLAFLGYYEQMAFWTSLGVTLTGSTELPSFTLDHGYVIHDASGTATNVVRRYLGCKINNFHLSSDAQSQVVNVTLGIIAQKPDNTFVTVEQPNITTDLPANTSRMLFQHLATPGYLKLSNSNRSEFSSVDLTVANKIDGTFNESPWITRAMFKGRDITWSNKLILQSAADRTSYEGITPEICEIRFDNSTNHCIFTLGGQNYLTGVEDSLDFDNAFTQTLNWQCNFDPAAGSDITVVNA